MAAWLYAVLKRMRVFFADLVTKSSSAGKVGGATVVSSSFIDAAGRLDLAFTML
jgi:hypothetical protein